MFEPEKLKWKDIQSPKLTWNEYFEHIKNDEEKKKFENGYATFNVNHQKINEIKDILLKKDEAISVLILGATWCGGCARIDPQFVKIEEDFDSPRFKVFFLEGVKKRMNPSPGQGKYAKPPEAVDPKYALKETPTIYFYNKEGTCFGRIERGNLTTESYEDELKIILEKINN